MLVDPDRARDELAGNRAHFYALNEQTELQGAVEIFEG